MRVTWGESATHLYLLHRSKYKNHDCVRLYGACLMSSKMKGVRVLSEAPFKKRSLGISGKIAKPLRNFTVADRNELALRTRTEAHFTPTASQSALRALTTHLSQSLTHSQATRICTILPLHIQNSKRVCSL